MMPPEISFTRDRVTRFLNNIILNPINAGKLAPPPEITQTSVTKQEKEEAFLKAVQEMKEFTSTEVNSILRNILSGFATEASGWNQNTIRASLEILPFIGLKKIYPKQISDAYTEAVIEILPSHPEVTAERGLEALIEAGMIFIPHIANPKTIDTEVVPILRQELKKRYPDTNKEVYERLGEKIDNLSNILRTGLIKPIDAMEIANKLRKFGVNFEHKYFSPEQSTTLDSLVEEAIRNFGMSALQIIEMSGITRKKIQGSIRRLKASGSIPDAHVHEDFLALQVQDLLGKGLTDAQIAHILGSGITVGVVAHAKQRLRKRSLQ